MNDLHSFFAAKHFAELPANDAVNPLQIGKRIQALTPMKNDWTEADIILIGCGEQRGSADNAPWSHAADAIREELYRMFDWHPTVKVADTGNILEGATAGDTRAALRTVLEEVYRSGKIAVILGGSQDLTLQQYEVFERAGKTIEAAVVDSLIDLDESEVVTDKSFLMNMLTKQPNFVKHFSQIGFQSYYVNPRMLETMDKLRFDCYRLGRVREDLEEMEPVLRSCDLLSIDLNVLRYSEAPFLTGASPNGLFGDELCQLTRYAGMSSTLSSLGIYGYHPEKDTQRLGAKLIAQMLWYFVDGYLVRKNELNLKQRDHFLEYYMPLSETGDMLFLKSKNTNRWWVQLPDGSFTPCSYKDYLSAGNKEIPEKWLRAQERIS